MIWQQDVTTIVMLTNLKEGDKVRMFLHFSNLQLAHVLKYDHISKEMFISININTTRSSTQ